MSSDSVQIAVPMGLEAAGDYLNARAAAIADQLQTLANQLEPLKATWTGSASTYYEGLQSEWNTAAAGLFAPDGVLGQIARAMNVNWGNYSDAEFDNTRTWQQAG
jgi:WXG100 family type VII secretion target